MGEEIPKKLVESVMDIGVFAIVCATILRMAKNACYSHISKLLECRWAIYLLP